MTIPPAVSDPEENRSVYKRMREFRDMLEKKYQVSLPYLSMGMSDDYKIAIEEGATIVRLGRILFDTNQFRAQKNDPEEEGSQR